MGEASSIEANRYQVLGYYFLLLFRVVTTRSSSANRTSPEIVGDWRNAVTFGVKEANANMGTPGMNPVNHLCFCNSASIHTDTTHESSSHVARHYRSRSRQEI